MEQGAERGAHVTLKNFRCFTLTVKVKWERSKKATSCLPTGEIKQVILSLIRYNVCVLYVIWKKCKDMYIKIRVMQQGCLNTKQMNSCKINMVGLSALSFSHTHQFFYLPTCLFTKAKLKVGLHNRGWYFALLVLHPLHILSGWWL